MTAGVEISLYITCIHAGIIDSVGLTYFGDTRPVGPGHSQNFFLYIFFYIFPLCWGSKPLCWVMTAGVEISLYITCMHGVNTGLGGPGHFGHSQNFWVRPDPTWYIFLYTLGGRNHFGG